MREDPLEFRGARVREVPRRNRTYGEGRTCAEPGCATRLSIYNRSPNCWQHEPVHAFVARGKRKRREAA
jgi:hypothetical protein